MKYFPSLLVFLLVALGMSATAQMPSPKTTQSAPGSVLPIQCLGCIARDRIVLRLSDGTVRQPTEGDFVPLAPDRSIRAIRRENGPNGVFFFETKIFIPASEQTSRVLNLISSREQWDYLADLGETVYTPNPAFKDLTRTWGMLSSDGQPWATIIRANGVCKGPVLRIAKQMFLGGDRRPLASYEGVVSYQQPVSAKSAEGGSETLPSDDPLVCMGDLVDADGYYRSLADAQIEAAVRELEARTGNDKLRQLMADALRAYLKEMDRELVDAVTAAVVDEMIKKGLVLSPKPPKPPPTKGTDTGNAGNGKKNP